MGAQGRRVWSTAVGSAGASTAAIVVPCEPSAAGAHPAAAKDRVMWSLEAVGPEERSTLPVVVVRLGDDDDGASSGLCLAAADEAGRGKAALVVEEEVTDGGIFAMADLFSALSRPALRATAAAAVIASEGQEQGQEQEQKATSWPFREEASVRVEPCSGEGKATQRWVREGALLRPLTAPGLCLAVASSNLDVRSMGVSVVLAACNATLPWQQWTGPVAAAPGEEGVPAPLSNGYQRQCMAPETDAPPGVHEAWAGPLADGGTAVLLFNRGVTPARVSVRWGALGLDPKRQYEVRDLWAGVSLPQETRAEGITAAQIPSHGVALYRVTPVDA